MNRVLVFLAFLILLLDFNPAAKAEAEEKSYAVFKTAAGDLLVQFFPEVAPKTVRQIKKLIGSGLYNGVPIHRIEPGFIVQVNDVRWRTPPLTAAETALIQKIPAEFSNIRHAKGVLSMARQDNDPDSSESSFSFLLGPAPHMDQKYTVFGRVIKGGEVLGQFEKIAVDEKHKPVIDVLVTEVSILNEAQVSSLQLAPASLPTVYASASSQRHYFKEMFGLSIFILMSSLAAFIAAKQGKRGLAGSLFLTTFLACFFFLYVLTLLHVRDITSRHKMLGAGMFLGSLICFKLMTRFETPAAPKRQ